ncbi:MAG: hypothetical protein ABI134_07925 [Byssovorax sp.]
MSALPFRTITPILGTVDGLLHTDPDETLRLGIVTALRLRRTEEPSVLGSLVFELAKGRAELNPLLNRSPERAIRRLELLEERDVRGRWARLQQRSLVTRRPEGMSR